MNLDTDTRGIFPRHLARLFAFVAAKPAPHCRRFILWAGNNPAA